TFASNNYNMGNYLGQNSDEIFIGLKLKPFRGVTLDFGYSQARKGPVSPFIQVNGVNQGVAGAQFMTSTQWNNRTAYVKAQFEIINDVFIFAQFTMSDIKAASPTLLSDYTPSFYWGKTNTFTGGLNIGF